MTHCQQVFRSYRPITNHTGFRSNRSCEGHIPSLTYVARNRIAAGRDTFAAFVDLQKAFDWVDRDLLLQTAFSCNTINGKIHKAIQSIYLNTVSCVRPNDYLSNWFQTSCGVRHGDVLSSTLSSKHLYKRFGIGNQRFKTRVPLGDNMLSILLYADDIVLKTCKL